MRDHELYVRKRMLVHQAVHRHSIDDHALDQMAALLGHKNMPPIYREPFAMVVYLAEIDKTTYDRSDKYASVRKPNMFIANVGDGDGRKLYVEENSKYYTGTVWDDYTDKMFSERVTKGIQHRENRFSASGIVIRIVFMRE